MWKEFIINNISILTIHQFQKFPLKNLPYFSDSCSLRDKDSFAHSSTMKMKIITFFTFFTELAVSYAVAVPAPAPDTTFPDGIVVKYYPNGLPAGLYPGAKLTSRATNLDKRDDPFVVDVEFPGTPVVGVYACRDINFSGPCVYIRSSPNQCGEWFLLVMWKGCWIR